MTSLQILGGLLYLELGISPVNWTVTYELENKISLQWPQRWYMRSTIFNFSQCLFEQAQNRLRTRGMPIGPQHFKRSTRFEVFALPRQMIGD
jgi:hypothetical protein